MALEFESPDRRFALSLGEEQTAQLYSCCRRGWPQETGGILIGYYTPDLRKAVVTRVEPPPPDSRCGPNWFSRGIQGLTEKLSSLWLDPRQRQYYLGEWHLHPNAPPSPSSQDCGQLQSIAESEPCHCPEPLLVIVGGSPRSWPVSVHVFRRGQMVLELNY